MYNPQTNHQPTMSYQLDQLIKNIRWLKPPNVGRCHCSQDYGWSPLWCSLPWRRDPGWRGRSELQQTTHIYIYISYVGTSALSSGAPTGRATNKNNLKQINNNNKSLESPIFFLLFLIIFHFLMFFICFWFFFYFFLLFFICSYFILFFFMCF